MTLPTKEIFNLIMKDFVRVSSVGSDDQLFSEQDLRDCLDRIETVGYHQEIHAEGIKFTPYAAGHVLGAAMFLIEIAGVKILYTGDYSREEDRHLMAAEMPPGQPDVLICESTYGVQSLEPRLEKEARFTELVHRGINQGGRILMPVFALGRAQELMLILYEYWSRHPELQSIPIYYTSTIAKRSIEVYKTSFDYMNASMRAQLQRGQNPWNVDKYIENIKSADSFDDIGPCVMMATPGTLQSGISRQLLERWCPERKNSLIVTGYNPDGTLSREILSDPHEITSANGQRIPRRCAVNYISFSAHVDFTQNSQFIYAVSAPHVVLVHGEVNAMGRLKAALQSRYAEREENVKVYSPRNCDSVKLYFRGEKMAKTIGTLARPYPTDGTVLSGILINHTTSATSVLLDPLDLKEYGGGGGGRSSLLASGTTAVVQRWTMSYNGTWELLAMHLQNTYGNIDRKRRKRSTKTMYESKQVEDEPEKSKQEEFRVMDTITIRQVDIDDEDVPASASLMLEWVSGMQNDMIADSVMAVIRGIESSPASVKATHSPHHHHSDDDIIEESAYFDWLKDSKIAQDGVKDLVSNPDTPVQRQVLRIAGGLIRFLHQHFGDVKVYVRGDDAIKEAMWPQVNGHVNGDVDMNGTTVVEDEQSHETSNGVTTKLEDEVTSDAMIPDGANLIAIVTLDKHKARVDFDTFQVDCDYEIFKMRIEAVMNNVKGAVAPLGALHPGSDEEEMES